MRQAAAISSAHVLLSLATRTLDAALLRAGVFWREFGRRYLTRLCHTPDLPATSVGIEAPPADELAALVESAPPMTGAEYLSVDTLTVLWRELDALVLSEIRASAGGPQTWLKTQSPVWHLVGRVTFHLARRRAGCCARVAGIAGIIPGKLAGRSRALCADPAPVRGASFGNECCGRPRRGGRGS